MLLKTTFELAVTAACFFHAHIMSNCCSWLEPNILCFLFFFYKGRFKGRQLYTIHLQTGHVSQNIEQVERICYVTAFYSLSVYVLNLFLSRGTIRIFHPCKSLKYFHCLTASHQGLLVPWRQHRLFWESFLFKGSY